MFYIVVYYGYKDVIREFLRLRVEINVRDYKGVILFYRVKSIDIMEVCFKVKYLLKYCIFLIISFIMRFYKFFLKLLFKFSFCISKIRNIFNGLIFV